MGKLYNVSNLKIFCIYGTDTSHLLITIPNRSKIGENIEVFLIFIENQKL